MATYEGVVDHKRYFGDLLIHFDELIVDPDVTSAGGFFTAVSNSGGRFAFRFTATLFFDGQSELLMPDQTRRLIATGENRIYEMSVMAPTVPGMTAAAFYFRQPQIGFIFFPGATAIADQVRVYQAVSDDEFRQACVIQHGIDFNILQASHSAPVV